MKTVKSKIRRKAIPLLILLTLTSFLTAQIPSVFAVSPIVNHVASAECHSACGSTLSATLTVGSVGSSIVIGAQSTICTGASCSPLGVSAKVQSITDGGDVFVQKAQRISCLANCGGAFAYTTDLEYWTAPAKVSGSISVTVTFTGSLFGSAGDHGGIELLDVSNLDNVIPITSGSDCTTPGGCGVPYSFSPAINWVGVKLESVIITADQTFNDFSAASMTNVAVASGTEQDGLMYSTSLTPPSTFPGSDAGGGTRFSGLGVVFQGKFTCSITNMDGGNYVIANIGKFYNFKCEIQSAAVSSTDGPITDIKVRFNDSVNVIVVEYNNQTHSSGIDSGGSIATLGDPIISQNFSASTGIRSMNVTFPIEFNSNLIDSKNRGIELYAQVSGSTSRGFEYVQRNYFNTYNQGGSVDEKINGLCAVPAGADTFQTICQWNNGTLSSIAENSTFYHLQQFQGLFSIRLTNVSNGLGNHYLFNPWARVSSCISGCSGQFGTSTNPGDWIIDFGMYHWDNSSVNCCWVKGIHAKIEMLNGFENPTNQWTQFNVFWYNGNTLIKNSTFIAYIEQNPLSQVTIWANFWYSANNASTTQGGRISAYYTGMHDTGFLWWTSWSPFLQNDTASSVFTPLLDHSGAVMSSTLAQFSKVFMNMSRPGAPFVHARQVNFQVATTGFQIESFGTTTAQMASVNTPSYTAAVIPIIQNTGFFSPLIRVIQQLATWIANALSFLGTQLWNSLASRFPWFTGTLLWFTNLITQFWTLTATLIVYVINFARFMVTIVGFVAIPIQIIITAYNTISALYLQYFGGVNLSQIILIWILIVFVGYIGEASDSGDTKKFLALAIGAWHVVNTIAYWVWLIAKFFIDAVEGLIP